MKVDHLGKPVREVAREIHTLISVHKTVEEAIGSIRKNVEQDKYVIYFYVVDDNNKLVGFVNVRDLLRAPAETPIANITQTKIKTILGHQTMQEGFVLMKKFRLYALPVIDKGKFIGILDLQSFFDEEVHMYSNHKRSDVFQSLGSLLEEDPEGSTWQKYRTRFPWIFCNMLGGIVCAIISKFYKVVLLEIIVLAMFIPLVLSLTESIAMQAMTQSIYILERFKESSPIKRAIQCIFQDVFLLIIIALTFGTIVGCVSLLWGDGFGAALIIGVSIIISVMVTGVLGALIPITLQSWKLDPKAASGPVVLMVTDVFVTFIYLSFAFWWLLDGEWL